MTSGWLRGVDLNHRPLGYEPNRTRLTRCDSVGLTRDEAPKTALRHRVLEPNWSQNPIARKSGLPGKLPHSFSGCFQIGRAFARPSPLVVFPAALNTHGVRPSEHSGGEAHRRFLFPATAAADGSYLCDLALRKQRKQGLGQLYRANDRAGIRSEGVANVLLKMRFRSRVCFAMRSACAKRSAAACRSKSSCRTSP